MSLKKGKEIIRQKIPHLTKNPGIYKMLGERDEILYVGKAKNIPNRLKSYIADSHLPIRTERMLSLTKNLETTTTASESEALLLEANLIKKHKPRFNILLRDDKSFPYIFIGHKDKWPQLTKLRGKKNRDGYYFGPFASVGSANWTIKILQKVFLLRVCDDTVFKNRERPCILYQIKRCAAPCLNYINEKNYKSLVENAVDFISGKSHKIQKKFSEEMEKASKELNYEKAAVLRDKIKALTQIQSSQKISAANLREADVISIFKESGKTCVQVFFFRSKQNWGNQAYFPKHDPDEKIEKILSSFIGQFYENKSVPRMILINSDLEDRLLLEKAFSKREKKEIAVKLAKTHDEKTLSKLAEKNAKESLTQKILETESNSKLIDHLSDKFLLRFNINLIEVYDNSHIQGSDSVGALIAFGKEGFLKKRYRKFNIKSDSVKGDDYGMMKEVLKRRFSKTLRDEKNTLALPDLILIDGGKGQLSAAKSALDALGLGYVPVIGLAKRLEEVFKPGMQEAQNIIKTSPGLYLLRKIRDEVHRYAISFHRKKRDKNMTVSIFNDISGLGKKRLQELWLTFKDINEIKKTTADKISNKTNIPKSIAKQIVKKAKSFD